MSPVEETTQGLAAILQANRGRYFRFLTARLGGSEEAEDLLQDIWIKLANIRPSGPIADPIAYLYRVVEYAARDRLRSSARRRERERNWAANTGETMALTEVEANPEQLAIHRERLRQIDEALGGLPERTRYILRAFRVDGRAQKDLANELGISLSAIEKHLQRAYKMLTSLRVDDAESGGA